MTVAAQTANTFIDFGTPLPQAPAPSPFSSSISTYGRGNLFRPFGSTAVSASTTLANVEVFASTNGQNVVMINKDPATTQTTVLQTTGSSATTVDVWQTDNNAPFQAPQLKTSLAVSGGISYALPAYSVTTFVFR